MTLFVHACSSCTGVFSNALEIRVKFVITIIVTVVLSVLKFYAPVLTITNGSVTVIIIYCINLVSSIAGIGESVSFWNH
ncbi:MULTISPECIES: hypothetical protein [unclassified Clostridium]|uniref:hypothetical protein n=1 Tax=unclassified Clostridium TaxID=2614128 RepID=UPI00029851D9|nr:MULTISPECIES: hypothetical protein [unclassified Clostridium]EKQ52403.1 MAG: hypothetical protein A370_04236 [Clostridium sp. Maddingley MBC34-26]